MSSESVNVILASLAVVLVGSALLGVVSHWLRQPLLVAYVLCGILAGPSGLLGRFTGPQALHSSEAVQTFLDVSSDLGILFLLFLVGMVLNPHRLKKVAGPAIVVALGAGAVFCAAGFGLGLAIGLPWKAALILGLAAIFSSTILVVKLLPTRKLHESPVGTVCVGVLILQDVLAIVLMIGLRSIHGQSLDAADLLWLLAKMLGLVVVVFLFEGLCLRRVLRKVERYPELLFIVGLGWCFAATEGARQLGFTPGIGAFLAGVSLARHPISIYISEKVQPLRDFFVVLFFFTLGARLDLAELQPLLLPAAGIAVGLMVLKPVVFWLFFRLSRTAPDLSREAAVRLSQMSEFSLILIWLAFGLKQISADHVALVQVVCLLTMILSTYWVVFTLPSPLAVTERLKQN
ncbi:MAG: hypothetical protein GWP05_05255 [Anaerolineaceae bacterium]|nr:hypothetical protein [Anaerolineaceae bacterium]